MNLLNTTVAGLLLATSSLLNIANAGPITLDLEEKSANSGGIIEYVFDDIDTTSPVVSTANFTLNLTGDFSGLFEYLNITLDEGQSEELNLGNVLDGNTFNDEFSFGNEINFFGWTFMSDWGSDSQTLVGTAEISQVDWTNIIADGELSVSLDASRFVSDFTSSGSISYDVTDQEPSVDVPEPASLAIFGFALLGFAVRRRAKK